MKVAIIGCGKVADQHASIIANLPGCSLIGVCDNELLMAKQMHERYQTQYCFDSAEELLINAKPDVVHITTPPKSHFFLGKLCLEKNCHVFIEKPFTLNTKEAEELIAIATENNLKLTVGTNMQFSNVSLQVRDLVRNGFLGGTPIHIESIFGYSIKDDFAKAFLSDTNHWVRRLPGKLLHNIVSHGIARISEFLSFDSDPEITAFAHCSPSILSLGGYGIYDELRVIIRDKKNTTAYFTFSSQINPLIHQFRLYGPLNSIIVDDDHQLIFKASNSSYKSYLNYFIPPLKHALQNVFNSFHNVENFMKKRLYMDSGKKALFEAFYESISIGTEPPIPYKEILCTSKIIDKIFDRIYK